MRSGFRNRAKAHSRGEPPATPDRAAATHCGGALDAANEELQKLKAELARVKAACRSARVGWKKCQDQLDQRPSAENALLTTEMRLRLVMRAASIGFWDWDMQTNSVYHSAEWKRQLGYEDHEITHSMEEWQSRLHPEDKARVLAAVDDFIKQPRPGYEMEFRLRHRDGSYRWIHSQGMLVTEKDQPARLLGVHVDITAGKQREAELRESEQRFRRLVETTHIIPWEADPATWRFTYVGPRALLILGYPLESWSSEQFWVSHLHPDDCAASIQFRREQAAACQDFESEYRMIAADGRTVWFHDVVHVIQGPNGAEKLQGFLVDVTERKRAAEEHARLAAIVESSNDAIIGETLDGIITNWNKSAERIYGYPAAEALGRSIQMVVPRERGDEVNQILARMKRGEIIEHFETLRTRKDGRQIHISLVVSPIRDVMGKIIGASAIARDITDRKQLEAEVLQISEREQQRIARDLHDGLGQLLSGTVHLSNVLQLELAEQALPEAAEALRITELLNLAVAETRSLARGLYPVRPEANGLMVALEELADRTNALFKIPCSFRCRRPVLVVDNALATHLYRIAQEAVTNAGKHGKATQIEIVFAAQARRMVLTVRDNGGGLPETPRNPQGMGIRIMQYRARMIGGMLSIENQLPHGVKLVCVVHRQLRPFFQRGHP